ncbi:ABC transporter ATP-binding protein [Nocardia miyunensis]|uniref:ABC transporter ATP-binding protein n=1 Tax=Nocardia miyunensis TaxID=282684 RepID=UPI000831BF8E|nr:ATP-binding cassette domain-containing protein [Nocardia miyunensis]
MLLETENLAVRYPNGALGIEDVSIQIEAGRIVALVGANGAGKTTTCRTLSGFLRTEGAQIVRGKVVFDGVDVTGHEPHRLVNAGIAAVPERNKVFSNLSVREHFLSAGMHRSGAERAEAVEFGLHLFPTIRGRMKHSAGTLSGGEQQMVAIIRALVNRPRLLIVDEMMLGLHASLQRPLFEALETIAGDGTACLVIDESATRTVTTAQYCYLLEGGRITAHGKSVDFVDTDLFGITDIGA